MLLNFWLTGPTFASIVTGQAADKKDAVALHPDVWVYDLKNSQFMPRGYHLTGLPYKALNGDISVAALKIVISQAKKTIRDALVLCW